MSEFLRSILLASSLAVIWPASASVFYASAQSQPADCPAFSVSCPDSIPEDDTPIRFTVNVVSPKPDKKLTYCWRVSRGKIKSGQGTATIEVEAKGADRHGLTATVDIGGLDEKCGHIASCTAQIH